MTVKTTPEKYSELIERGYIKSTAEHVDLTMPGAYRTVPTKLVYRVPEPPIETGIPVSQTEEDALERQSKKGVCADAESESGSRGNEKEIGRDSISS